ncbi:MAG: ATP-binding protein [Armatimonadota bacterium]
MLHLYASFPITVLRLFKWGSELSLVPILGLPARLFINWYARNIEAAQVIAFEEVVELIENARACSIGDCPCLRVFRDDCGHTRDKCVRLNAGHDVFTGRDGGRHRPIGKRELIERLGRLSRDYGLFHNKIYLGGAQVYAICTCCDNCIAYRMHTRYGQPHAFNPGRYTARADSGKCAGCGACTEACRFGVMRAGVVAPDECFGCGLCRSRCPREAITLRLREHAHMQREAAG